MHSRIFSSLLLVALNTVCIHAAETVWLDSLDLSSMQQGWGVPKVNQAVTGKPLSLGGKIYEHGVGTHAVSSYVVKLAGGTEKFQAVVGVDDHTTGPGTIQFRLIADGKTVFDSGVMRTNTPPKAVDVDLQEAKILLMEVDNGGDNVAFDHADWADARFVVSGAKPVPHVDPPEKPYLLTPKPGPAPRINGPLVYGAHPGHPFLYRIPAQGIRPMTFRTKGLPEGLTLDAQTGIISGTTPARGEYNITFSAKNSHGSSQRTFKLVAGDKLSLTPSMGWNHWYAHYNRVTDKMMREAADVMIASGMADVGYQYVNIDDCWMNSQNETDPLRVGPFRDAQGQLLPNKYFPDMKGLADYIHRKGLKAGLYTSPGPTTCAGFAGAYEHEAQDARLFADWGYDFLKYDWCSYTKVAGSPLNLERFQKPYRLMGKILQEQNRDILLNLCQYGMGEVWKWGEEVGGQSWRTGDDLGFELNRIFEVAIKNASHRGWQRPGAWNDPDYIQIGYIGNAGENGLPGPSNLSPSEQYAFMSLWCLMASPLFYSGDMSRLDEFTLNVLCNPDVIDIDQDPLGQCARVVPLTEFTFLMIKDMADGSAAVGLCNRGRIATEVTADWNKLAISGPQRAREVWTQKSLGVLRERYSVNVPARGVALIRLWPVKGGKSR